MANGPIIEHDPDEPKKAYKGVPWWVVALMAAAFWAGLLSSGQFNWYSVAVGGFSGLMLATWAIEVTDNKVPKSWKSKSTPRNSDSDL